MLSLLEPSVAWLHEHYRIRRPVAAFLSSSLIWLAGFGTVFSFASPESRFLGKTLFGWLDHITANIGLPVAGLLMAVFAAWVLPESVLKRETGSMPPGIYRAMYFLLRYITPVIFT